MRADTDLPFLVPEGDDPEMVALIESWRYAGPPTAWEAIVGHEQQILRCRELVERLRRSPEELSQLRIRVGAGMVICGPAGVGKTLLARALATAAGRAVIAPPTAEMTPSLISRLYAQLMKMGPSIVLLDEAEGLIGEPWQRTTDEDTQRAFLQAIDGVQTPAEGGPVTLALTTAAAESLNAAATRPGRLAPRLQLSEPSPSERRILLQRAIAGLPSAGPIDLDVAVDRTGGWTGAELAGVATEAISRSLLERETGEGRPGLLRPELIDEILTERFVARDERPMSSAIARSAAIHEAGHWLAAELLFPGHVAVVRLTPDGGSTQLSDEVEYRSHDVGDLAKFAKVAFAGSVAEQMVLGADHIGIGGEHDKQRASRELLEILAIERSWAVEPLEAGTLSDRGSERMRAALHVELEARATTTRAEVVAWLTPHTDVIRQLADVLLSSPSTSLTGEAARAALRGVMAGRPASGAE